MFGVIANYLFFGSLVNLFLKFLLFILPVTVIRSLSAAKLKEQKRGIKKLKDKNVLFNSKM